MFGEHHQQFQVIWNGNGGRTSFYQSEIPYDPPNQASYSCAAGVNGWASYKVADSPSSRYTPPAPTKSKSIGSRSSSRLMARRLRGLADGSSFGPSFWKRAAAASLSDRP